MLVAKEAKMATIRSPIIGTKFPTLSVVVGGVLVGGVLVGGVLVGGVLVGGVLSVVVGGVANSPYF